MPNVFEMFALGRFKKDASASKDGDMATLAFAAEERELEQVMPAGIAFRCSTDKARALSWFRRGDRAAGVALPVHTSVHSPASVAGLRDGDCKVYDEHGNSIHLKKDEVAITAEMVRVSTDIASPSTSLEQLKKDFDRLVLLYNAHFHPAPGTSPTAAQFQEQP